MALFSGGPCEEGSSQSPTREGSEGLSYCEFDAEHYDEAAQQAREAEGGIVLRPLHDLHTTNFSEAGLLDCGDDPSSSDDELYLVPPQLTKDGGMGIQEEAAHRSAYAGELFAPQGLACWPDYRADRHIDLILCQ